MDPVLFLSFLAATALIIGLPGPSVALTSSQLIKHGRRAAVVTVAGDALGSVVHILIAVASLQVLIGLADIVLPYLQIAGGCFILWLALQSFRAAGQSHMVNSQTIQRSAFLAGFFACVTNPKAIVFFVALFPGFISTEYAILPQTIVYGAVFVFLDAASILGYAFLADHLVRSTIGSRISIDTLSGWGLFGVGVLLIFKGWKEVPAH
ncbi:MAG: LysE family translocator [Sulfitobacter sp.]